MKVKVILPEQYWTQERLGDIFTVVPERDFKRTQRFVVLNRGEETHMRINNTECEKIDYGFPVRYSDLYKKRYARA